jgi:hypothetical protein
LNWWIWISIALRLHSLLEQHEWINPHLEDFDSKLDRLNIMQ